MFRHVKSRDVDLDGITIMGEVTAAPASIVKLFGPPSPGDGYKISGEYAFVNHRGQAFVLHDWLCTSLYDSSGPTPELFWASGDPFEFSVSSMDLDISEFAAWLQNELRTKG
jgi:hypothetical protein